jgi:hypothetical protein
MNKFINMSLTVILASSVFACVGDEEANIKASEKEILPTKNYTPPPKEASKGMQKNAKWYTGTLKFYDLEGGFYGFTGENGKKLLPLNLGKEFKQNGAKIKLYGYIDNDIMTIQMWGTPFKVLDVQLLEKGSPGDDGSI